MRNRILSLWLALVFLATASLSGFATLTNSSAKTDYSTANGTVSVYSALITATANDTTTNADSNVIVNLDGSVKDICAAVKATNQTGTSPTLTISFLASGDNAVFHAMKTAQADTAGTIGTMASSALDINTASSTNVGTGICLSQFGRGGGVLLPPYMKIRITVGGSGSPGWTGVATAAIKR